MPDPLDLEAIRQRADARQFCSAVSPHIESADDVPALLAEVERLRTIAAPLERLEAWAFGDENETRRYVVSLSWDGSTIVGLYVLEVDKGLEFRGANMADAITAALDSWDTWDAKYGKDAPHA